MTQRKARIEAKLETLENWLAVGGRFLKLIEILEVKVNLIPNHTVQRTAHEDLNEMRMIIRRGQAFINWIIRTFNL